MIKRIAATTLAVAVAAATVGPAFAGSYGKERSAERNDIVKVADAAGSFSTLIMAVKRAGLVGTLKSDGPFTVFAPTDEAFAKLPPGALDGLLKDKEALKRVLLYHVVPGELKAAQVVASPTLTTANGLTLNVDTAAGVKINESGVVTTDVMASNGVIHIIDTVLLPE